MSKTVTISDETWSKIKDQVIAEAGGSKELVDRLEGNCLDALVGTSWFLRTVTYHIVGKVVGVFNEDTLIMDDAAWVADSGRFMQALQTGILGEVEPVGLCLVRWKSVTDSFPWKHALPLAQK